MAKKYKELTTFGKWIMIKLIEKNMTVTELAKRVGTTKHRISEITHGVIPGKKYKNLIINELSDDKNKVKVFRC